MKKMITLSVLALIAFLAKAQTEKNKWLVGGSLGFTSSTQKESDDPGSTKTTVFQLSPNIGYFFINNLAAGLNLNASSSHYSTSSALGGNSSTVTYFTAGPFVRYYFNTSPHVKLFVHGDASWGSEKYSNNSDQDVPSVPIAMYNGKAGAALFLSPNVALELTAGYQAMTEKDDAGGSAIKFTTGSFIAGFGFQIYLGSAKK